MTFRELDRLFNELYVGMTKLPKAVHHEVRGAALTVIYQKMLPRLQTEPGKPGYPLTWRSPKQRRFVMAKLRREGNLPYQRTHGLARGWRVNVIYAPSNNVEITDITITNSAPYADFVVGPPGIKQPMFPHWKEANRVIGQYEGQAIRAAQAAALNAMARAALGNK